jgi:hypothetical protein
MRLRPNCLLNETTLKQHNRNQSLITKAIESRSTQQQQLKLNLNLCSRRGSLSMDSKHSDANGIDSGGTDEVDNCSKHAMMNGSLHRRCSFTSKNDRGMVSR